MNANQHSERGEPQQNKVKQKSFAEWRAVRLVHIAGGCRAFNGLDDRVELEPLALNGLRADFTTRAFGALFDDCQHLGLTIIGTDFYTSQGELDGRSPPEWRSYHKNENGVAWHCEDEAQRWSQIRHSAFLQKNGRFFDIAARICHQLRTCSWRLRQVSESYRDQLQATLKSKDFLVGLKSSNGFTDLGYLAIQSFLVDACVLRDYFAEFCAMLFGSSESGSEITTMGGLVRRKLLDRLAASDSLASKLKQATDEGGWLRELGDYRDLVVHSTPLVTAREHLFATYGEIKLDQLSALPSVEFPIPKNPSEIFKSRSSGSHFESFEKQLERMSAASRGVVDATDGLRYCHSAMGRLCALASELGARSPITPQMIRIDKEQIVGEVKIVYE